jgi:hypothetical protein
MSHLIEQTGPDGSKFLASSADGMRLLTDENCEGCCGANPCASAYVYFPCPPPILSAGGSNIPSECYGATFPNIRVCEDATCNGTPIRDLLKIIVNGRCYSRGPNSIPNAGTGNDPNEPLIDSADIVCSPIWSDCDNSICVAAYGRRFILGAICAGQDYNGPLIYFLACAVRHCGTVAVHVDGHPGGGIDGAVCVRVEPGQGVDETAVPAGAIRVAVRVDATDMQGCCECLTACQWVERTVNDCNGIGAGVDRSFHCCCSVRRTVVGSINSVTTFDASTGSLTSRSIVGSGTWQKSDDDSGTGWTVVIGGFATVTEKYSNGPDQVYNVPIEQWAGCGDNAVPSGFPFGGAPFGGVEECNPGSASNANYLIGGVTNKTVTCRTASLGGSWSLTNRISGVVEKRANSTSTWSVTYFGRCSGQCAGSDGAAQAGIITARKLTPQLIPAGCAGCGDEGRGGATI